MCVQRCLREQYVCIVPYEPSVMFVAMDGSFFVSAYPGPKVNNSINTKLTNYIHMIFECLIYTKYYDATFLFSIIIYHINRMKK